LVIAAPITDPYIFYLTKSELTPNNTKAFLISRIKRPCPTYEIKLDEDFESIILFDNPIILLFSLTDYKLKASIIFIDYS
jgi:hypothetical protein